MNIVLQVAVAVAAFVFVAVSATMNALFLSSLGRTPTEVALLAAVSLASDVVKAVLPVIMLRAVMIRAWTAGFAATVMLVVVVALSLASGTGFAALTRGAAIVSREGQAERLVTQQRDLAEIERRIEALASSRPAAVIEQELNAAALDRRWQSSNACSETSTTSTRLFCTDVLKLRGELATAKEHDKLLEQRQTLRTGIEVLRATGAGIDADPQSSAIADLLGVDRKLPRVALTTSVAVVLELGSVILVLLMFGRTLRGWREPGTEPKAAPAPAELPMQADRSHWRRQRERLAVGTTEQSASYDR